MHGFTMHVFSTLTSYISLLCTLFNKDYAITLMFLCFIRYGSFHGQSEQLLSDRFVTCRRTADYVKNLPGHHYEVDTSQNTKEKGEKSQVIYIYIIVFFNNFNV